MRDQIGIATMRILPGMNAWFVMRQHPAWHKCPPELPSDKLNALISILRQQRQSISLVLRDAREVQA
jgi:hypothetical protein